MRGSRWPLPLSGGAQTLAGEGYNPNLYGPDGASLTHLQYETLEIALDQAQAELGVERGEWQACEVEVLDEDGALPASLRDVLALG